MIVEEEDRLGIALTPLLEEVCPLSNVNNSATSITDDEITITDCLKYIETNSEDNERTIADEYKSIFSQESTK